MRSPLFLSALMVVMSACGDYIVPGDPDEGNDAPPRVISGGGIGDGAIDGVVHVYVIDDLTRMPVAGADVRIGEVDGTTDEDGLFTLREVVGPQTIAVKAPGYRGELWVGANGANVTIDVVAADQPAVLKANLSGEIGNFSSLTVAAGHEKVAVIMYSHSDEASDAANNLPQPNNQNTCTVVANEPCLFTVTSRVDKEDDIALIAAIFDRDPAAGTQTLLAWAYAEDLDVRNENPQTDITLQLIPSTELRTITVDFGSLPAGAPTAQALIGVEIKNQGTLLLPSPVLSSSPTLLAPKITAFRDNNDNTIGEGYRMLGLASSGTAESTVTKRDLDGTTTSITAPAWLPLPTGIALTRTGGTWTGIAGATASSIEITQGATSVVNVSVLDGTSTVVLPDLFALPAGQLTAKVLGLGAPMLDLGNFSLDTDYAKITAVSSQRATIE